MRHLVREHVCELRFVVEKRHEAGGDVDRAGRQWVCEWSGLSEQPERKQPIGVNGDETLADAVDVVGDELVVVETGLQPEPISIVADSRTRRLSAVVVVGHGHVLPLDFVEVCVDFVAKVEVGLVLIEPKGLELLVPPGVALGSCP